MAADRNCSEGWNKIEFAGVNIDVGGNELQPKWCAHIISGHWFSGNILDATKIITSKLNLMGGK